MSALLTLSAALLGLAVGSFLNVLIVRLPRGESPWWNRSHCMHCGRQLGGWELIPVVSFLLLRGRCRGCQRRIRVRYLVVEVVTAAAFTLIAAVATTAIEAVFLAFVTCACIVVFATDLEHELILDRVTLPAIAVVVLLAPWLGRSVGSIALGGVLGGGFFFLQYVLSRGRWVGDGDIRMGVLMGLALGPALLSLALVLAYVSGSLVAVPLLLAKRKRFTSTLPFGTFLAVATVVALLWGEPLLHWYLDGGLLLSIGGGGS